MLSLTVAGKIVVGRSGTEMLTNEVGEVTSHLQGMFTRTIRLLEVGIKPVYVFYTKPPDLKKQELAKRYSKRADATDDLSDALEVGSKDDIEKFSKRTIEGVMVQPRYATATGVDKG